MDYRPKTTTSYATQRGRDSGAEPQLLVPHSSAGFLCAHCPCHPGEHCVYPPPASLCISLPDHSQELLHHQAGLRSQNLYPEKAEVILGPAESAMGTSSIYTAHVQRTPWPPTTTTAQTQSPGAGANGWSDLPKHTSKPMLSRRGTCCALPSVRVTRQRGWRRPRGKAGS